MITEATGLSLLREPPQRTQPPKLILGIRFIGFVIFQRTFIFYQTFKICQKKL